MSARDGKGSVGVRLRWLERFTAEQRRPGCPHCRDGYGARVSIVDHDEELPPFDARCTVCGREFDSGEGVRVVIRGIAPDELASMQASRELALQRIGSRGTALLEGSN